MAMVLVGGREGGGGGVRVAGEGEGLGVVGGVVVEIVRRSGVGVVVVLFLLL